MSSIIDPTPIDGTNEQKTTYAFTLLIAGVREVTDELEDALYGGSCRDALLSQVAGHIYLDFDREAESWTAAIMSAIEDVEGCGMKLRVARVLTPGQDVIKDINAFLRLRNQPELRKRLAP
jgi:hypothetical protein